MVFSSNFLDHAAEDYLRANSLIMSAQQQQPQLQQQQIPIINRNGTTEWSNQSPQPIAQKLTVGQLQPQLNQIQSNQSIMQTSNQKISNGQLAPARVMLICHPNSHPFQVKSK